MKLSVTKIIVWLLVLGGVGWLIRILMAPIPGRAIADQGREHVSQEVIDKTVYNSNPPVSGPHLETWVKPGIYLELQRKGELIHSLEHGYVEIHYTCSPTSILEATDSATLQKAACKTLASTLEQLAKKEKLWKLLVVYNPTITHSIVLAAWGQLEELDSFDEKKIVTFIDYWRDHGPEQTME